MKRDTEAELNKTTMRWLGIFAAGIVLAGIGFWVGWYAKGQNGVGPAPQSLRLGGYQFINPLLVCNINNSNVYSQNTLLSKQLQSIIDTNKADGNISKAS